MVGEKNWGKNQFFNGNIPFFFSYITITFRVRKFEQFFTSIDFLTRKVTVRLSKKFIDISPENSRNFPKIILKIILISFEDFPKHFRNFQKTLLNRSRRLSVYFHKFFREFSIKKIIVISKRNARN